VEPRLTGGFHHGRVIRLRSGGAPRGLDAQSPEVLAAVARIRARAAGDTSPEALGALAVTYLVSGDPAAAVKALESAVAQDPNDARLQTDLAAAYLVRAAEADEPADLPRALESAERAIALKGAPQEAWFNRALALERLHLVDAARKAWQDYLERDASSPWADEARQRLEALPKERKSSAEEDKARVRAALDEGPAAVESLADEAPQLLRDYFEDELLPAWAEAHLVGHPDARRYRGELQTLAAALFRTSSDALALATARALSEPRAGGVSGDPLRLQALGFRAHAEGRRLYDLQDPSCGSFRDARAHLEAGASPHAARAALEVVIACLYQAQHEAALRELRRLETLSRAEGWGHFLGRVHWIQGLLHGRRGELTDALAAYRAARSAFRVARDTESEARIAQLSTEAVQLLGDARAAWREREQGLALLPQRLGSRQRWGLLDESVLACLDDRQPRAALHFVTALVDASADWPRPFVRAGALVRRASIRQRLGDEERAAADVLESRRWIARISDPSLSRRVSAEADAVEGEVLLERDSTQAEGLLRRAATYFEAAAPVGIPALHLALARAAGSRGLDAAAEAELDAGIRAMERGRTLLNERALQASFFEQALPLFDDMVRLQVAKRHDPERALAFVERGRARQLIESLARARARIGGGDASAAPLEPETLRRQLSAAIALIYHVALEDRLFAWAVTQDGLHFVERPRRAADLARLVAAHRAGLERRAPVDAIRVSGSRLYEELVRPLLPFVASRQALVFIPDGVLQGVAFASLWDRQTGRYLAEDHLLGLAPSGTVFIQASARAAAATIGRTPRAVAVGNPRFNRSAFPGLADLPEAEAEATEVAALYAGSALLTGAAATKDAFFAAARVSEVVHYAGHAAAAADAGAAGRLLFAPSPESRDSGVLPLEELDGLRFPRTRVVVLAACRTAAGAVSRVEGPSSLGRPFLAAGVADVVASLWDVDDALSRDFFITFHRALLEAGDAPAALRKAQIAFLRDRDASVAHPASWAAFICMGGLNPRSLSKGELS
jgi:CHAT domain-containing protein